jgi:hypothetical protein
MSRRPLWFALVLVLAVNAVVLAGVARNRAGTPDAALTLTERELVLSTGYSHEENSGVALELVWNSGEHTLDWFDQAKLAELGLGGAPDPDPAEPHRRASRALPKKAFVVLEFEGAAWERFKAEKEQELAALQEEWRQGKIEKEEADRERAGIEGTLRAGSRLFAVDAGIDPGQLRQRFPDRWRYIIAPALVRVNENWEDEKRILRGHVDEILTEKLHVNRELHSPLLALPAEGRLSRYVYHQPGRELRPRYEVQVAWGKRLEPWVVGVKVSEQELR